MPDFPYKPHYLQWGSLLMAYIDERSSADSPAETFLCLHGQPTWSFLYRKMIPHLLHYTTLAGAKPSRRVIALDFFGFGRSDKPTNDADYTFTFHRESLLHLIRTLDLENVTLVVQDWGGLLGLTLPLDNPGCFKRLIVMNTGLGTGTMPLPQAFLDFRDSINSDPDINISGHVIGMDKPVAEKLTRNEIAAYDAPFPDQTFKAGPRRFPNIVPVDESYEGTDISKRALEMYFAGELFGAKAVFVANGSQDPMFGPMMREIAKMFGKGRYFMDVPEAGHFPQEFGEDIAKKAIACFEKGEAADGVEILEGQ